MKLRCFFLSWAIVLALGLTSSSAESEKETGAEALDRFYRNYEDGNYSQAISSIPSEARDISPYGEGREGLSLYKKDEAVYLDIEAKGRGEKEIPKQLPSDKEVQYYLGVMDYRLNDLERAKLKFLKCLQMDPFYRMAHVYLFRTFYRLQTDLLEKSGRVESVGTLFIEKLGFGTADLHYEMASELLKIKEKGSLRVLKVRFLFDNSAIKDFKTETARVVNLKDRGDFAGEIAQTGLWRVELLGRDRHCLDEAAFVPQRTICWDGINAAGQMTGGSKIVTTFSVELMLAMQQDAERVVIYDAVGKKAYEHRL